MNKKENTIEQFLPAEEDPRIFSSGYLYVDSFNTVIYLSVWTKTGSNEQLSDCRQYNNLPYEKCFFRSQDEGKTWQEDKTAKELFIKNDFRQFEFLDKDYALAYSKKTLKRNNFEQGTYYLLKNMQIIDSLQTPKDINYYNDYRFCQINDTIFLGVWTYNKPYYINLKHSKPIFQPLLKKVDNEWKFQIEKKKYPYQIPQKPVEIDSIKEYKNFQLINNHELVFKNGSGSLNLKQGVKHETSGCDTYFILEKDSQIYLINDNYIYGHIYISFDSGTSWYLYPLPLEQRDSYKLLDIDEQNEISHFSDKRTETGQRIRKIFHKFSLK